MSQRWAQPSKLDALEWSTFAQLVPDDVGRNGKFNVIVSEDALGDTLLSEAASNPMRSALLQRVNTFILFFVC